MVEIRTNYSFMPHTAEDVLTGLSQFLEEERGRNGQGTAAVRPGHRRQFSWPNRSVSAQYHVRASEFTRKIRWEIHGEAFDVAVAETPFGLFAKCDALKAEAKGSTEPQLLKNLAQEVEPLFARQFAISRTLGLSRRFEGEIHELDPIQLVRLLYCSDRDVANTAMTNIDAHAKSGIYTAALIKILLDETHPNRRIAQWCVLDIFEDLPNICVNDAQMSEAIEAIAAFMKRAPDDYARAVYKAGDVLGDHLASDAAAEALFDVLEHGEQPFGRRSAIHGLIHLCEWLPQYKNEAVRRLTAAADGDPEPLLRDYAANTIRDIEEGGPHGPEPVLPGEAA